ncbi:sensor histidine kinase [Geobacter argillaceus]|uniref:histidine kinase n=1 Tax=Geobacter argillaceus TaxID=345631 RepID=A0A562VMR1_9BACT|nr:ATP-binding protein [Geobacter argillaceus]TWJ19190.1 PAS domain S-box-containing protein [Geobacter argillaceus]
MGNDKEKSLSTAATELRRHAEAQLRSKTASVHAPRTTEEMHRLVHELEVHQIELEMQNAELHQTRDLVEAALEKYTDLYDFAPVGYFTLDRSGIIIAVNLTGAGILGIERTLLIGRRFGRFVANEARPHATEFLEKVFASQNKEFSEITLTAEGNLPRFVQIEAIASGSGQECHVAVIDITERKRVDAEIQRFASFPLMNPNPVLELDANGQMTFCNPAAKRILENSGYDNGINPLIPQDIQRILQDLQDNKADQFFREIEIDERFFEELIYVAPQFQTVRIYTMDISLRKQAEKVIERLNTDLATRAAELEAANRELEAFNYTVAHDLRKPLTVVNGYCQALRELCGDKLDEQCNGYLREAYDGTWRMNRLIDALLDFSRLGHVEPRREPVNLSTLAHEVAAELKLAEPERRVTFQVADKVSADGDASLLRMVLANLLGNAWKYTGTQDEGIIEFGTTEVNGRPTYFVRDNGAGFDMADADKLFIPFQRLPGAEECRGFGIGLATVERIIRRHGGKVWAEGVLDKGACFWFTLSTD